MDTYVIKNNGINCFIISNTYNGDFGVLSFDKDITALSAHGSYAGSFNSKKTLNAIILPESITNLLAWTFIGTTNLSEIILLSQQPPFLDNFIFYDCNPNLTLFVPDTSVESYKAALSKNNNYNVQPIPV